MKNDKIKNFFMNRITIGVICFILGGVIMGGPNNSTSTDTTTTQVKEDTKEEETKTETKKKNEDKKSVMKLNEVNAVTTKEGDYNMTVEGIRFTKDRNQFSDKEAEHVFLLDFNYENINMSKELFVSGSNFKIMDEEGNILDSYPVSDDNRMSKKIPEGAKCSSSEAYALPKTSKTLKILYYDNMFGNAIGEMTIETGL